MTEDKKELFSLIKQVLNHELVQSRQINLYKNYDPGMTEDVILASEHKYLVPMFVIMPMYEKVGYHLAWCGSRDIKGDIATAKMSLSLLTNCAHELVPRN